MSTRAVAAWRRVAYPEEGHGFLLETNRYDVYGRVARFLATHLDGNRAAPEAAGHARAAAPAIRGGAASSAIPGRSLRRSG